MTRRIAFLTAEDARDPRFWSGTPYHIAASLAGQGAAIDHVGPLPAWPLLALRARKKLERTLGLPQSLITGSPAYARFAGLVAGRRIAALAPRPDVVFSPAGSALVAHLEAGVPLVYLSDATVRLMVDYYPQFTGLSRAAIRAADGLERAAIAKAALLVYPTRWAADSAVRDYGADPAKIIVAPLGANMDEAEIGGPASPPGDGICRLLFVGTEWERKGGDIALRALEVLRGLGVPSRLTLVGATPPGPVGEGVEATGFLDKNKPADRARLAALYREADFFILPTRHECYGIVFCEAAAYGVPSLATRTGGVPDVVAEGETGFTLPPEDRGEGYAAAIAGLWADPDRYQALRASSRRAYETRLNWDAWGRTVMAGIEALPGGPAQVAQAGQVPDPEGKTTRR